MLFLVLGFLMPSEALVFGEQAHDGWKVIEEKQEDAANTVLSRRTHLWGPGEGGVGALLASGDGEAWRYYAYDGNGNVSEVLDAAGATRAHYEYDPFGRLLASAVWARASAAPAAESATARAASSADDLAATAKKAAAETLAPAAESGMKFGQATVKSTFAHGPHAGKTVGEVAAGIRSGAISPNSLPVEYVIRNGEAVALNNRSLLALRRAGVEPTVTRNMTGNSAAEALLDSHLRGGVPSEVIRVRGGPAGTSQIE
jgi:YD repeat-containing protein